MTIPFADGHTGSLSTSEVKRHRARLVLGRGAAWEVLRVLSAFASLALFEGSWLAWTNAVSVGPSMGSFLLLSASGAQGFAKTGRPGRHKDSSTEGRTMM